MSDEKRFEFGRNWRQFVERHYSQDAVDVSRSHILEFLKRQDLKGLRVIDIGCGSGIHSMAIFQAGAASIHSFDYDPTSVEATTMVRGKAGSPPQWTVEQGSVLDESYMRTLPTSDLVYSWGVLHHTGDVWSAIDLAAERVRLGGLFYIALYSADVQEESDAGVLAQREARLRELRVAAPTLYGSLVSMAVHDAPQPGSDPGRPQADARP